MNTQEVTGGFTVAYIERFTLMRNGLFPEFFTGAFVALCLLFLPPQVRAGTDEAPAAARFLEGSGVRGGLVVHLGCDEGRLTASLRTNDSYVVEGLDANENEVEAARKYLRSRGLYGPVSVEHWDRRFLPYTDNLVQLLVAGEPGSISRKELMRVLAPGGVLYVEREGGWRRHVKQRPAAMDEWTHFLHDASNNAVAQDSMVGPPRHMQWKARPLYCRHHEIDSSISAMVSGGGRLFYILDEAMPGVIDPRMPSQWSLVARDAFSGVRLWKRPVPNWGWQQWKKMPDKPEKWAGIHGHRLRSPAVLPRRLVVSGDQVYATLGYEDPVTVLDAGTGDTIKTLDGTARADEILHANDTLFVCKRPVPATGVERKWKGKGPESVLAVKPGSGQLLWRAREEKILPLSLAVAGGRVVYHNYEGLVCLDRQTGKRLWATAVKNNTLRRFSTWRVNNSLLLHEDVVLFATPPKLRAFSAKTGELLWTAPGARGPGGGPPDLFVINDVAWAGGPDREWNMRNPRNVLSKRGLRETLVKMEGHNLRTGDVARTVQATNLLDCGHHFRCYRSKATERFILWSKRGVEYLDLKGGNHARCEWTRGACRYGFMPANGMLYVPPHQCFCYPSCKLNGLNAYSSRLDYEEPAEASGPRLVKGPAYDSMEDTESADAGDWPTYRCDHRRSGSTETPVSPRLERAWKADVGGKLTAPVAVDGRLYVCSVRAGILHCLDAENGEHLWDFTAGSRIDSPPTYFRGRLIFGSDDGWVYCLRAADGAVAWRFHAAPSHRRVVKYDRVVSAWPVHGSVLVMDGTAYFSAGRSSFLDGGMYLYALDAKTGRKLHRTRLQGPSPDLPAEPNWPFHMDGARSDVLVAQNGFVYLRQIRFNSSLERLEAERMTRMGDLRVGEHLMSTSSLLDRTWWNRSFWMYSRRWPGYYFAAGGPKVGQILVFDDEKTYGLKVYKVKRRNRWRNMFFPGMGYQLFADDNDTKPVLNDKAPNWDKGPGYSHSQPALWQKKVPVRMRALVLAGERLFGMGPPDVMPEEDRLAAFEGKLGSRLWVMSAADGRRLAKYSLDLLPVFDGMIAANGRLYCAANDGHILCLRGRKQKTAGE